MSVGEMLRRHKPLLLNWSEPVQSIQQAVWSA